MTRPDTTWLYSGNAPFIDSLYEAYLEDPRHVARGWQAYFDELQNLDTESGKDVSHLAIQAAFVAAAKKRRGSHSLAQEADRASAEKKQVAVLQLINAYRFRGHRQADLDPLRQYKRPQVLELDPEFHGLTDPDMDVVFNTGSLHGPPEATLREILHIVRSTYCRSIGAEYMHINDTEQKRWIQQRLEENRSNAQFTQEKKRRILERVIAANALEQYLHTKYVGQKRFSLEGAESLISLLDELIQQAGTKQVREVVIGMAHRGRLNVLVNTVGKYPKDLFQSFEGTGGDDNGSGDVKYHQGYSSDIRTPGGPVHLTLAFNPSHLEIIDPVVEGSVRARQERRGDRRRNKVLPVLIHGDAAFAGQGVVMETFNLSQTRGYTTGGTVHIIVNNQIGFTTSDPLDSRSTLYCTDVAKMVQAPIFHVNGDDPEAAVFIAQLALDFRMEFNKDVVIDLVCYRKHGHSEADEPAVTQPTMYKQIRKHPGVRRIYTEKLIAEGVIPSADADTIAKTYIESLEENQAVSPTLVKNFKSKYRINYEPYRNTHWTVPAATAISLERVKRLTDRITTVPDGFRLHPSVEKIVNNRRQMGQGTMPIDWGFAENLAYASVIDDGYPVRLSGQDTARGTFFHRHAVLHDQKNGDTYIPLQHIKDNQANFLVLNSILSEEAVLGFEYGYSSAEPNALVIWEAQFGDFANNAQVVIDQFVSSSEAKWGRYCGLAVFMPHGYDGQGPEHSSARLERFLQLCADDNMQVCVPSTPAQMFHMLRRQALRPYRKPLVVMTPKSLLRHKLSTSNLDDLTQGGFKAVFDEVDPIDPNGISRLLFCSGKVYFDVLVARRQHEIENVAIVRIEQLYPFPNNDVQAVLNRYPNLQEVVWVQEEPQNQGSWYYLPRRTLLGHLRGKKALSYVGRPRSASPAVGYMAKHLQQQKKLVADALKLDELEMSRKISA
ncbi:MAG: 2-oxoglutarate dehydrogenase E1 component [Gammaproteobacteria bacterium]|nr:2-oxoglutarate dehydrogenase E1 component [Gammaproteobacteria bacterium]MCI0590344.1 2-oxoglutarate dehydrogenase E1 component [Gammaproteobacteria bacterium]